MIQHDARFSDAVAAAVAEIERTTDAELVVVAVERSATYREISARGAAAVGFVAAVLFILLPVHLSEWSFVLDVTLVAVIAERLLRTRRAVRALTSVARRQQAVREAAARVFVEEAVHGTPHRSGVLIYVSALEQLAVVQPDLGVLGKVPAAELNAVERALRVDDVDSFVAGLGGLGAVLAKRVPWLPDSDVFDLPNHPIVRS